MQLPKVKGEYRFNENLAKYTWFKTGGNANVLFIPVDKFDLINFLKENNNKLPITVIGYGSNLLIRDGGIDGVVILLNKLNKVEYVDDKIKAESGASTAKVYLTAKNNGIGGFEFLGTIPGTVGGACKMNAGCYGKDTSMILESVEIVDLAGNVRTLKVEECGMSYRKNSLPEDTIFLSAIFKCEEKKEKSEIEELYNSYITKRQETQPINERTCGSTFMNLENYPAWKVVKDLGFQNVEYNGVKMSEKHANFLINVSSKKSQYIEELIKKIQDKAKEKLNIDLKCEIKIIGKK